MIFGTVGSGLYTKEIIGGSNMIGKKTSCYFPYPICLQLLGGDFEVCEFFHSLLFLGLKTQLTKPVFPPWYSLVLISGLGKPLLWMADVDNTS